MMKITEGLIIGVGAGISTTILLGAWRMFVKWGQRREQIAVIREDILKHSKKIFSAIDIPGPPDSNIEIVPADMSRFANYRNLETALEVAFSSRSNALSYKQLSALQAFIEGLRKSLSDLNLDKKKRLPLQQIYRPSYEKLAEEKWLRLPNLAYLIESK